MKKWIQTIFGLFLFLSVVPKVAAEENKIKSIHIDVELHDNGSATIRETRQMETNEHTELYIVLENLGDTDLVDFKVEGFTEELFWNIEDSFEEKANKYGVIDTDDGYELAWGISEYGTPEYQIEYTLSNLVRNLDDGQALFWNFDSFLSLPADRLTFEISTPFPLEDTVLDYYGFGFEGPIAIENGVLEWTGYGLDEENDVIALLQFPTGTFNTSASVDMTLEEQREMATDGSSYNEEGPMPLWAKVLLAAGITIGVGTAGGAFWGVSRTNNLYKEHGHFRPTEYQNQNVGKISPIPPQLEGDIGRYSFFISQMVMGGGGFANYFMAYLLFWSLEDRITIETREEERRFFGPKVEADIFIQKYDAELDVNKLSFEEYVDLFKMGESTLEEVFWTILLETADADGQVDGTNIQKWSGDNAEDIAELVTLMNTVSEEWLVEHGYLNLFKEKGIFGPVVIKQPTKKGDTFAHDLAKFHNFIKEIKEVNLQEFDEWHELIVWAALFGEAEDTVEYLEEFHPDTWAYLTDNYPYVYGSYYGYHHFYTSSSTGLANAGYGSSGGSGMSSGGGGGGAGGGGGGGSR